MSANIQSSWWKYYCGPKNEICAFYKETLGRMTILKWHCWKPMRKVIGHHKMPDGKINLRPKGWVCPTCGHYDGLLTPAMM